MELDPRYDPHAHEAAIYQAWLDHNVAVVPGQELELDDFVTYSRRFGQVAARRKAGIADDFAESDQEFVRLGRVCIHSQRF